MANSTSSPPENGASISLSKESITRAVGVHLTIAALIGLFFNVRMFRNYMKMKKRSSFFIMCASKTVSNSLILIGYLIFIAPTGYLYTQLGPQILYNYLNQIMSFGLYLQGPIVQMTITVNRFLVVYFTPSNIPSYSNKVTVGILAVIWTFTAWFSLLLGLPENCKSGLGYGHLPYVPLSPCATQVTWCFVYAIFFLAIFTNLMNILIAAKLIWAVKFKKGLSSESSRDRLKRSIRYFVQSCCQDWISVLDVANNIVSSVWCGNNFCSSLMTMGFDVMVYGFDGIIMFIFTRHKPTVASTRSRFFQRSSSNQNTSGVLPDHGSSRASRTSRNNSPSRT